MDHMRAVEGTRVAVLVRELLADDREGMRKVSPSGHRRLGGCVADRPLVRRRRPSAGGGLLDRRPYPELVDQLRGHVREQLPPPEEPMDGVLLRAKPAGVTSHDVVAEVRALPPARDEGRPCGDPRPVRDRIAARARRPRDPSAALPHGAAEDVSGGGSAGLDLDTGDRDGELVETGRMPGSLEIPMGEQLQTPPAYSAVKVGGRRAYDLARAGETPELKPRPVTVTAPTCLARGRARRLRDRVLLRHIRALARNRPWRRLLRGARADRHRPVPARGRGSGPASSRSRDALAFLPERALSAEEAAPCAMAEPCPRRGPAGARTPHHEGESSRSREPRDGELQPVVVFAPA